MRTIGSGNNKIRGTKTILANRISRYVALRGRRHCSYSTGKSERRARNRRGIGGKKSLRNFPLATEIVFRAREGMEKLQDAVEWITRQGMLQL